MKQQIWRGVATAGLAIMGILAPSALSLATDQNHAQSNGTPCGGQQLADDDSGNGGQTAVYGVRG